MLNAFIGRCKSRRQSFGSVSGKGTLIENAKIK